MAKKDEWKLVSEYGLTTYANGLKAGDRVRLKEDIRERNHKHKLTGEVRHKGEVWTVLCGVEREPHIIWLRRPDGERHTWDLEDVFSTFELIEKAESE